MTKTWIIDKHFGLLKHFKQKIGYLTKICQKLPRKIVRTHTKLWAVLKTNRNYQKSYRHFLLVRPDIRPDASEIQILNGAPWTTVPTVLDHRPDGPGPRSYQENLYIGKFMTFNDKNREKSLIRLSMTHVASFPKLIPRGKTWVHFIVSWIKRFWRPRTRDDSCNLKISQHRGTHFFNYRSIVLAQCVNETDKGVWKKSKYFLNLIKFKSLILFFGVSIVWHDCTEKNIYTLIVMARLVQVQQNNASYWFIAAFVIARFSMGAFFRSLFNFNYHQK